MAGDTDRGARFFRRMLVVPCLHRVRDALHLLAETLQSLNALAGYRSVAGAQPAPIPNRSVTPKRSPRGGPTPAAERAFHAFLRADPNHRNAVDIPIWDIRY
jgi:hypothetical protein